MDTLSTLGMMGEFNNRINNSQDLNALTQVTNEIKEKYIPQKEGAVPQLGDRYISDLSNDIFKKAQTLSLTNNNPEALKNIKATLKDIFARVEQEKPKENLGKTIQKMEELITQASENFFTVTPNPGDFSPSITKFTFHFSPDSGELTVDYDDMQKLKSVKDYSNLSNVLYHVNNMVANGKYLKQATITGNDEMAKQIATHIRPNDSNKSFFSKLKDNLPGIKDQQQAARQRTIQTSLENAILDLTFKKTSAEMGGIVDNLKANKTFAEASEVKQAPDSLMFAGQIGQDAWRFTRRDDFTVTFSGLEKETFKDVTFDSNAATEDSKRCVDTIYNVFVAAYGSNFEKDKHFQDTFTLFETKMTEEMNKEKDKEPGKIIQQLFNDLANSKDSKDQTAARLIYLIVSQEVKNNLAEPLMSSQPQNALHKDMPMPEINIKTQPPQNTQVDVSEKGLIKINKNLRFDSEKSKASYNAEMHVVLDATKGTCTHASVSRHIAMKKDASDDDIANMEELMNKIEKAEKKHDVNFGFQPLKTKSDTPQQNTPPEKRVTPSSPQQQKSRPKLKDLNLPLFSRSGEPTPARTKKTDEQH
jgi:hypothetical protein